jgi:hypothetical protein
VKVSDLALTEAEVDTTVPFLTNVILERFSKLAEPDWYKVTDLNNSSLVSVTQAGLPEVILKAPNSITSL